MDHTKNAVSVVTRAAFFAAEAHKGQHRKSDNSPYVNHPLGVANMIVVLGNVTNENVVAAAMLHDTIEDTKITEQDILTHFGETIAHIVLEVTDDKSLPQVTRKKFQIDHAHAKSYEAKLVKLADKLHNLTSLLSLPPGGWCRDRIQGYFVWSKFVIDELRGTNEGLEKALDDVFTRTFTYAGIVYPVLPKGDLTEALDNYYSLLSSNIF